MRKYLTKTKHILRGKARRAVNYIQTRPIAAEYRKNLQIITTGERQENTVIAVVIHLYYTDNWPLFKKKLQNLFVYKFDLFVTIPKHNIQFLNEIKKDFPTATIVIVPNHGRDVVPFLQVARMLKRSGYEIILKFHSKKSTHRQDGQEWLEGMLDKLLPDNKALVDDLITTLHHPDTGVVGPSEVYYPLTVNFPANGVHMTEVVNKLYGRSLAYDVLQARRDQYGFFAGTMFWVRLDAIERLLEFPLWYFERERGQIDATFAHALERLFCIVPEINQKVMYEISESTIRERAYVSGNIPEWSEDHLK